MKLSHKIWLGVLAIELIVGSVIIGCAVDNYKAESVLEGYHRVTVVNCEDETIYPFVDGIEYTVESRTVGTFLVSDSVKIGNCTVRAFEECNNVLTCSDGEVYLEYYN